MSVKEFSEYMHAFRGVTDDWYDDLGNDDDDDDNNNRFINK